MGLWLELISLGCIFLWLKGQCFLCLFPGEDWIFDENTCGKWGKEEGVRSNCEISKTTRSMVPQCVVHLQMGWTGKLKMYLYSLPSVLAAFHWYKSAWSALVCSPNSVPGRVVAWEVPGKCGASSCQVQPGAAGICPPSTCCRWRACLHTSAEGLLTVFHSRMNLHVIPCCGHCHLFGRFNCSLCLYGYYERSSGSGAIILWCVYKSSCRVGVQFQFGTKGEHCISRPVIVIHSKPISFLTLCRGRDVSPCLAWERGLLQSACIFTRCNTAV